MSRTRKLSYFLTAWIAVGGVLYLIGVCVDDVFCANKCNYCDEDWWGAVLFFAPIIIAHAYWKIFPETSANEN